MHDANSFNSAFLLSNMMCKLVIVSLNLWVVPDVGHCWSIPKYQDHVFSVLSLITWLGARMGEHIMDFGESYDDCSMKISKYNRNEAPYDGRYLVDTWFSREIWFMIQVEPD